MTTKPTRIDRPGVRLWLTALVPLPAATAAWARSPAAPAPGATSEGGLAAVAILLGALAAILTGAARVVDLRRRRADQTVHLQARIADALVRDPSLATLPITPVARVPLWRGSPVTIEVTGWVPSAEMRKAALRLILREAAAIRWDFRVEDRMVVAASTVRHAA